ncbi:MAG: hypothetical protein HC866_25805 [Leptolyngbyaceae cyanobacterium RU_5_1]|nr:hypothetical protein [Leptolyngbyaceae cyanobacterium RU_5_1]
MENHLKITPDRRLFQETRCNDFARLVSRSPSCCWVKGARSPPCCRTLRL